MLPIAQYPIIAPARDRPLDRLSPRLGRGPLYRTTRLIEDELNGAPNILSFESASDSFGVVEITATFRPGTDPG